MQINTTQVTVTLNIEEYNFIFKCVDAAAYNEALDEAFKSKAKGVSLILQKSVHNRFINNIDLELL